MFFCDLIQISINQPPPASLEIRTTTTYAAENGEVGYRVLS